MAEIIMPKMGDAMSEGKVVRWYKKAGDAVKKGEPLLEIETDKVNLDLEAESDGTLSDLQAEEGAVVPVGGVLAHILGEGEKAAPAKAEKPSPESRRATDKKDSVKHSTGEYGEAIEMKGPRVDKTGPAPAQQPSGESDRRKSSPLARKMARELGVSLDAVQGSGPKGRIVAADVKNFRGAPPAPSAAPRAPQQQLTANRIPLSGMRRTIAKRLAESTGPIPHFYLTADYDVTQLMAVRQQLIDIEGVKISLNDFIIRAAALALRHHPFVNASWGDDFIGQHAEVHIGVAVSTPEGLITPVVRDADTKSVRQIAEEVRALADKAKNRKLTPNEYQGSTFTISNLGAWGIEEFTAIINPPNVAILAIGAAEARPVVIDRQVVIRERMKITMSCDHRVIDGAAGAEYLRTLRQYLEQPLRLVM
ncbi:MAG TPA: dihydrolipoamide acetyltransferase family protein [Thermoanaerobaculia bacterium]|nr:dihydrolipoamide acetyltransferase family protein [Thermoanaerobaculia bacterium]